MTREEFAELVLSGGEVTVWVQEDGCYGDRWVKGVWADVAVATTSLRHARPGGWQRSASGGAWSNGLDWDDASELRPYALRFEGDTETDRP